MVADPNPVNFGQSLTITANLSDSSRGGSIIASTEYSLDDGSTWSSMSASDGTFDEVLAGGPVTNGPGGRERPAQVGVIAGDDIARGAVSPEAERILEAAAAGSE